MGRHSAARVAILTHLYQGLDPSAFLHTIAFEHWRKAGIEPVVQQGLRRPVPAEAAVLHVNLTRMPPDYAALAAGYPRCLNGGVTDIAKRRLSDDLVSRDDDYDGPVVVKTDLNHAGLAERRLALASGGRRAALAERWRRLLPGRASGRLAGDAYRFFERKDAVPRWIWRAPGLVVERLRRQRVGALYGMNMYFFLGDCGVVGTTLAREPLVKSRNAVERLPLSESVPTEIVAARRRLGLDYGKIDYVVEAGVVHLLDANPTPHAGPAGLSERGREVCRRLAPGIETFLASAA